jgi:hypothetical protein
MENVYTLMITDSWSYQHSYFLKNCLIIDSGLIKFYIPNEQIGLEERLNYTGNCGTIWINVLHYDISAFQPLKFCRGGGIMMT